MEQDNLYTQPKIKLVQGHIISVAWTLRELCVCKLAPEWTNVDKEAMPVGALAFSLIYPASLLVEAKPSPSGL